MELVFSLLIFVMVVTFSIEFIIATPDGIAIGKGWLFTECTEEGTSYAVGMIGAVIMPHNLFLHSALVQSRVIDRSTKEAVEEANYYFTMEGGISLLVSFYINM